MLSSDSLHMRNVSPALRALVESGSYGIDLDVLIEVPIDPVTTALRSYRSYLGENWISNLTWTEDVDQTIASGTLTLIREHQGYSLAPLMEESEANQSIGGYAPAIDAGRELEIRVAIVPQAQATTLSGLVLEGATTIVVSALPYAAAKGTRVLLNGAVATELTADVAKGETSLPVVALAASVASGQVVIYGALPDAVYNPAVITYGIGNWIPLLLGTLDKPDWGGKANEVSVTFRNRLGVLADAQILDAFKVGLPDVLTPVETVIQQIINHEAPGTFDTVVPLPESPGFDIQYGDVEPQLVWEAMQALVGQYGGRIQYKQPYGYGDYELCLVLPPEVTPAPQYTLSPYRYIDLPTIAIDPAGVRNVIRIKYVDEETGDLQKLQYPVAEHVASDPSVQKYGERRMQLAFGATNAINTEAEANNLLRRAYDYLSTPFLPQEVECFTVPWPELDDVVTFPANGFHYDSDQVGVITGITWTFPRGGGGRVRIRTSEKAKGGYARFQRMDAQIYGFNATQREPVPSTPLPLLLEFGPKTKDALGVTPSWVRSLKPVVAQVWVYEFEVAVPFTTKPAPDSSSPRTAVLVTENEYTITYPAKGHEKFVYFVPVTAVGTVGPYQVSHVLPVSGFPTITGTSTQGSSELYSDVTLTVEDPQGIGGNLFLWLNRASPDDANPGTAYDAGRTLASTPSTSGPLTFFAVNPGGALVTVLDDVRTHPALGKMIFAEFVNNLGVSSGKQKIYLKPWGTMIDGSGALKPGAINSGNQITDAVLSTIHFAANINPVRTIAGSTLPTVGLRDGDTITLTGQTPRRVYQWSGVPPAGAWVDIGTAASAIFGQLQAGQFAAGSIRAGDLAADSVLVTNLVVGSLDNLAGNGHWRTGSTLGWTGDTARVTVVAGTNFTTTNAGLWAPINNLTPLVGAAWTVNPGDSYHVGSAAFKVSATWNLFLVVRWYDRTGAALPSSTVAIFLAATATTQRIAAMVTAPANASRADVCYVVPTATPSGTWQVSELTVRKAAQGELIVDGSITALKVNAAQFANADASPTAVIRLRDTNPIPLTATAYLDLAATGTAPVLKHAALSLNADGSARFAGEVSLTAGQNAIVLSTGASPTFTLGAVSGATEEGITLTTTLTTAPAGASLSFLRNQTTTRGITDVFGDLRHGPASGLVGFFGTAPVARPTLTGSKGGNAALASVIAAGAALGLWIDSTT